MSCDPGLNRLLSAFELMLGIAVTIGVVYVFMHVTKVLWTEAPAGPAPARLALLAAQHRGITLLAMLLGGLIATMASLSVLESAPREQILTMVPMPIPMLASMALAVELVPHHTAGIVVLAFVMGLGTYMRKLIPTIGPRAVLYGVLLFVGYMFGFLSGGAITLHELGWFSVILWLAVAVSVFLKLLVHRPLRRGRLGRTSRAFRARCRSVIAASCGLFDAAGERERARAERLLHRRLARLNETALVIDASIAASEAPSLGVAAFDAHDELFELELVVQNIARITERLAAANLPPRLRAELRAWLTDLRAGRNDRAAEGASAIELTSDHRAPAGLGDEDAGRVARLATAIIDYARVVKDWPRHHQESVDGNAGATFESPVRLIFGDLPGSMLVGLEAANQAAAQGSGRSLSGALKLDAPAQIAIRLSVAVGGAAAIGSILSERRYYWAVFAVFVSYMGVNTATEQVTKAITRVVGTVIGILIGSLLANAVGPSSWSIAVILAALGIGTYFIKVSYGLFVIGITVMVAQLYAQLGEYSNHLLVLRLEETAIGAAIGALAALVIFPVPTRRAATIAAVGYLNALGDLLEGVGSRLRGEPDNETGAESCDERDHETADERLTIASRAVDHAALQFTAATRPLRYTPFRRDKLEHNVALVSRTVHQARNLAAEAQRADPLAPRLATHVTAALEAQRRGVQTLADTVQDRTPQTLPNRLDDEQLTTLDESLKAARAEPNHRHRGLLQQINRLDETIAELHANITSRTEAPLMTRRARHRPGRQHRKSSTT